MTAQVARVVVRDFLVDLIGCDQTAFVNQFGEHFRVVHDREVAVKVGVFVFEGVEAVWAPGNDRRFFCTDTFQQFNVLCGQHLKQVFHAKASCRVTGARFVLAKDGKRHASVIKKLCGCLRDLFGTVIDRTGTAGPEQVFVGAGRVFTGVEDRDVKRQFFGPFFPFGLTNTPRVPGVFDVFEHHAGFLREA